MGVWTIKKTVEISASHSLMLDYESKCCNLHGHNWIITVYCRAEELNNNGMIVDFTDIKRIVKEFDHKNINELISQPTAENMAKLICDKIKNCYRVDVQESTGNIASYEI